MKEFHPLKECMDENGISMGDEEDEENMSETWRQESGWIQRETKSILQLKYVDCKRFHRNASSRFSSNKGQVKDWLIHWLSQKLWKCMRELMRDEW